MRPKAIMTEQKINSHILKLQGKAELPQEIELGSNYHIALEGSIIATSEHDNENGTSDKVYTFRPVKVEILTPKGKMLKLKDSRKNSQKLRNYLFKLYAQEGYVEAFDQVYDNFTLETMSMMPELLRGAIRRINEKT